VADPDIYDDFQWLDEIGERFRKLHRDLDRMKSDRDAAKSSHAMQQRNTIAFYNELAEAKIEIERLRTALQPLADIAERIDGTPPQPMHPDDMDVATVLASAHRVTLGQARAARRVLTREGEDK